MLANCCCVIEIVTGGVMQLTICCDTRLEKLSLLDSLSSFKQGKCEEALLYLHFWLTDLEQLSDSTL